MGGFQLTFVSISWVINHITSYNLLSSLNAVILTNESTRITTGHVIYNPAYTYKFQLKTTHVYLFT